MKCDFCGNENDNESLYCKKCGAKLVEGINTRSDLKPVPEIVQADENGGNIPPIISKHKNGKKWLLVAIPLLLIVVVAAGFWAMKNIDMDDPDATLVKGNNNQLIFNLTPDEFVDKLSSTGAKESVLSVDEYDRYTEITLSSGVEVALFKDEFKPKISSVTLTVDENATIQEMIMLDLILSVTAAILDRDFDTSTDNSGLVSQVNSVAGGDKQQALFENNEITYYATRDDGEINVLIIPTEQLA